MRKSLFIVVLLAVCGNLCGQSLSATDTGKYRLLLPAYWKPGSKVWRILDEKLPHWCPELQGKELCGDDCNPAYRVEFFMTGPAIQNFTASHIATTTTSQTWNIVTNYSFECSLLLFTKDNKLLTRVILIGQEEEWKKNNRAEWADNSRQPAYIQKAVIVPPPGTPANPAYQNYLIQQQLNSMQQITRTMTPNDYIRSNTEALYPTQQDLFGLADTRIRSL